VHARSKILVVEDDDELRERVASRIEELGVKAEQAQDGIEALERLARSSPPGAIFLDVCMSRRGGQCLLALLRREPRWASIPIITMSGAHPPAPGSPVTSRSVKSFDVEELAQILVSLCGG